MSFSFQINNQTSKFYYVFYRWKELTEKEKKQEEKINEQETGVDGWLSLVKNRCRKALNYFDPLVKCQTFMLAKLPRFETTGAINISMWNKGIVQVCVCTKNVLHKRDIVAEWEFNTRTHEICFVHCDDLIIRVSRAKTFIFSYASIVTLEELKKVQPNSLSPPPLLPCPSSPAFSVVPGGHVPKAIQNGKKKKEAQLKIVISEKKKENKSPSI